MGTWTENQIAALTGAALAYYNSKIASGMRPADALNATLAIYPTATSSSSTSTGTQVPLGGGLYVNTQTGQTTQTSGGGYYSGAGTTTTNVAPLDSTQGMVPLGGGLYVDPRTGQTIPTTGGGYFAGTTTSTTGQAPIQQPVSTQPPVTGKKLIYQYKDAKGNTIGVYDDGTSEILMQGAPAGPTSEQRSAFALLKDQLESWGLGALADWATQLYQGENPPANYNEFYALMKQQPVYQERFGKTNALRTAAGMAQLTEGQIMALESSYKKTMKAYGLPDSFYDQPSDYQKFIVNDISAAELADRVQAANAYVKTLDPNLRSQLNAYYGINDGALAAFNLDPKRGQDLLQQLASKTTTAIAAATAGLGTQYAKQAELAGAGELGFAKQAQLFGQAAQAGERGAELSQIYKGQGAQQYGTDQAVTEMFGGAGSFQEQQKRKKLARMEENVFGGSSGVGGTSLGAAPTAGAL